MPFRQKNEVRLRRSAKWTGRLLFWTFLPLFVLMVLRVRFADESLGEYLFGMLLFVVLLYVIHREILWGKGEL